MLYYTVKLAEEAAARISQGGNSACVYDQRNGQILVVNGTLGAGRYNDKLSSFCNGRKVWDCENDQ